MSILVKFLLFAPAWVAAIVGIPLALIFGVYLFFKAQYDETWGEKKEDNRTEEEKLRDRLKTLM